MAGKRDYYEVLGVDRNSDTQHIEKAYRKLARQYHPDRNIGDAEAEHKFKEVTEAHEVLINVEKRDRYDRYGHAGLEDQGGFGPGASGFSDLVTDLFSAFMGGGGRKKGAGPRRGDSRRQVLKLELHQVLTEFHTKIHVRRRELCPECRGNGSKSGNKMTCVQCQGRGEYVHRQGFFEVRQTCPRCGGEGSVISDPCNSCRGDGRIDATRDVDVKIPAGADTGLQLLLVGEGDAGQPGAPRGDLQLIVQIAEHPDFQRDGVNLLTAVPISYSQAALGATVEVPTLTGKTKLTIPRGTQSHTELRVAGEGMPELRVDRRGTPMSSTRRGDLRVVVVIETPQHLSKRQEELLRELADLDHKDVSPARKGFLGKLKNLFGSESQDK
jgi:molecular chaperone DnaJ